MLYIKFCLVINDVFFRISVFLNFYEPTCFCFLIVVNCLKVNGHCNISSSSPYICINKSKNYTKVPRHGQSSAPSNLCLCCCTVTWVWEEKLLPSHSKGVLMKWTTNHPFYYPQLGNGYHNELVHARTVRCKFKFICWSIINKGTARGNIPSRLDILEGNAFYFGIHHLVLW